MSSNRLEEIFDQIGMPPELIAQACEEFDAIERSVRPGGLMEMAATYDLHPRRCALILRRVSQRTFEHKGHWLTTYALCGPSSPRISVGRGKHRPTQYSLTRMMHVALKETVPKGKYLVQACGTRGCIKPDHYEVLDHQRRHRRLARHSKPKRRRLTNQQARDVHQMSRDGWKPWAIARRLDVGDSTVRAILAGRTYCDAVS